jgi:hypothetical protein
MGVPRPVRVRISFSSLLVLYIDIPPFGAHGEIPAFTRTGEEKVVTPAEAGVQALKKPRFPFSRE